MADPEQPEVRAELERDAADNREKPPKEKTVVEDRALEGGATDNKPD
jgi:hypothetical protein